MTAKPTSRRVNVIRHLAFEDLGLFKAVFEERGMPVTYFDAGLDELAGALDSADLAVVLGGPIGVYETRDYPFLSAEIQALQRRLQAGRPTLGICLGAQLIAAALDARIYPGDIKEIGWDTVELTVAGQDSCLSALDGNPVLHWHGDTFDLPAGARLLASTAAYPHQAFAIGRNIIALQFHAEADPERIEQWLIGHTCELRRARIDPTMLRRQTLEASNRIRTSGPQLLRAWLDQLAW